MVLDPKLLERLAPGRSRRGTTADPSTTVACARARTAVRRALGTRSAGPLTAAERRYLARLPPSVQGRNGSRACLVACLRLLTLTGGDVVRTWTLLVEYNRTRCEPPWDEQGEHGPDSLPRNTCSTMLLRRAGRQHFVRLAGTWVSVP